MRNLAILAIVLAAFTSAASADSISDYTHQLTNFQVITSGEPTATASQIRVYLRDNGDNSVTFHFENLGTFTDSVTEIYFQDGAWLQTSPIGIVSSNPNVIWTTGATPGSLPGGSSATPPFTTDVELDSQAIQQGGQPDNGINNNPSNPYVQGDWLNLTFNYVSGKNFQDVLNGLNAANPADRLELGFHVTGYNSSASVVQWGGEPTGGTVNPGGLPLPKTAWAGMGLLGMLAVGRTLHARRRPAI